MMNAVRAEAEIQQLIKMTRSVGSIDKQLIALIVECYALMTEEQKNELFSKIEKDYSGEDLLT
tara:strand:+ start:259 stop:447 length:189 start_codon:yes stop_codon:yes gene_type:complete